VAGQLSALLADEHLAPLWAAVHGRLCKGGTTDRSVVTLPGASPETRRGVDRLLGRVSSAGKLQVRLGDLEAALRTAGTDIATVVATAVGPVVDRAAGRAEASAAAGSNWQEILSHPVSAEGGITGWLGDVRSAGRLDRAGGKRAVIAALDVLAVLPLAGGPVGRSVLAATILGDEHGLDDNTPVGRLVVVGLAARAGLPAPVTAVDRASLWAVAGVSLDAVSTPALTLGLRPLPVGPLTEAACRWADSGVPLPIPAAAVAAESWKVDNGGEVYVCENPSVLEAAAARFGAATARLICVSGMPGRAVTALLASLDAGGSVLRYHGDFGAGGIAIANLILRRHNAGPWRMNSLDHKLAVERLAALGLQPVRLRGRVPQASWDADLAGAVVSYGMEITEEHVLDDLLADLERAE
jgi:uncharacterized protein (TIGR02679 family)